MRISRLSPLAVLWLGCASTLAGQQADVIRGRVTGTDGAAIEGARVRASSIPGNVSRETTTDRDGRYGVVFANGEGDYWITVSAIGYAQRRFEVRRLADEAILIGDVRLAAVTMMEAVEVQAPRSRVSRDGAADVSGTDRSVGNAGVIDPNQAGDLAALAASLPGVQVIPGAEGNPDQFSVFGLSGDQNSVTLNGLAFGGSELPRDAAVRVSLGTSPWDVSRGGFSGAQLGLRTQAGSNFSARQLTTLANAPLLQWTDAAGRSTGAEYGSVSAGGAVSGPLKLDRTFLNLSWQLDRRGSDLVSLANADAVALATAGVAADSAARLRQLLGAAGVPVSAGVLPLSRTNERGMLLAAIDVAPASATSGRAMNVTFMGGFTRVGSQAARVAAMPTADTRFTSAIGMVQARLTDYIGFGVLTETSAGASVVRMATTPLLALPAAGVRVASTLPDGSDAIANLAFGGAASGPTVLKLMNAGAQQQLSWFSRDNRHRLRLTGEARLEAFEQELAPNTLGSWVYNSLADLGNASPAAFMRTLGERRRSGRQLLGALSLGDAFRPSRDLQVQVGVRVDGNRFLSRPAGNATLRDSLGADNRAMPNRVYVSPRAGFAWTYGVAPQLAVANGFVRGPRAVVRGGIGVFQNLPAVQLAGGALGGTGLPDAVRQVACVGSAVPEPDWSVYAANPAAIPDRCTDGTPGMLSSQGPDVTLFASSWAAPRSLRANLNWSGAALGRLLAGLDVTWSRNARQAGFADLNFDPAVRFTLPDEGGRPVFVDTGAIVGATGAIAPPGARLVPAFGAVREQRSDLRSENRQVTVSISPLTFSTSLTWSVGYVYSSTRDVARGFGGTTGADPRVGEWSRSALDSRHQVVYSLAYNFFDWVAVSWTGTFRSGLPFTPLVGGDINGDGYANDRAFVFDPGNPTLDTSIAAGMSALLTGTTRGVRQCLARQLDAVAGRNSCQAPWTSTSSLTIAPNPVKLHLPQRLGLALYLNNVLGAADLLLHGERDRKGWGQSAVPDPTLLYVRGFDATTRRYRYDVNPRFGATDPRRTLSRNPVVLTLQVRYDIGTTRERQLLTQQLDRGRTRTGSRPTAQELRALSGALLPANPMALILRQADSLKLTRAQADSLAMLNRVYTVVVDSLWTPVNQRLATLPDGYDRGAAYRDYRRAREGSVDALLRLVPDVRGLLTAEQRRLLPAFIAASLDTRYLASVRSSTAGGVTQGVLGQVTRLGQMAGTGNAPGNDRGVMNH